MNDATSNSKAPKFGGWPLYVCPECEGLFQCVTTEGELRVRLHQILHVTERKERWQLLGEWRSRQAQLAGSVVV